MEKLVSQSVGWSLRLCFRVSVCARGQSGYVSSVCLSVCHSVCPCLCEGVILPVCVRCWVSRCGSISMFRRPCVSASLPLSVCMSVFRAADSGLVQDEDCPLQGGGPLASVLVCADEAWQWRLVLRLVLSSRAWWCLVVSHDPSIW